MLVESAAAEFNECGFGGTDTNKIARRAGFAPQTFYRWFEDKRTIFIEVYERWRRDEFRTLATLIGEGAGDVELAKVLVEHHKAYMRFRRSLRQLALEDDTVRAARARSRREQVAAIRSLVSGAERCDAELAAMLLQIERLADALAEGEFTDMGVDDVAGLNALARLIGHMRSMA